ncbi:hypothetical protein Tco_0821877 [Tanacetum coccineum]|uniref:Uncharacterized protein n=1 Tax=Tanacetum coccineum TaxID=301880 RepID=A0ABQ5AHT7_9ASTR
MVAYLKKPTGLATGQKFNFSKLIFDEPFNDTYETPKHTKKVFTNMKRKGKDFSGRVTPLFASMLAPPVVGGEGSGQPSEPQPPSSTTQPIIEEQIPLPQTSVPIPNVADEAVFKERDDRVVRATTTAASLDAAQASGNITKTQSMAMSNDPLSQEIGSGVNTPGSDEERNEQQDLTDFVPPTPHDSPLSGGHTPRSDEAKKVKRLEKALRARTPGMKLFKIGTSRRKGLDKENVSKEGRKSDKTKPMSARPRTTSVVIRNVEEEPRRATPVPTVQSQDKGKGKMEPEPTPKNPRKAQIQMDEELAQRLFEEEQAQFKREQRIAREIATEQEAKDVALIEQMEDVQARMDADELLAARLQEQEREQFSIDEQARFLVETIAARKNGKKDDSSSKQAESSKKRPRAEHDEESVKKQKLQDDAEKEELRACLDIVKGDDIAIDVESLATKYPIVDWKTHILTENLIYYQII